MTRDKSSGNSYYMRTFSKNVRSILKARGLSQAYLARTIGAKQKNVSNWLRLAATPDAVWVGKIAECLNTSLDELYGRENRMPEIRHHAQSILLLAGAVPTAPRKKSPEKRSNGKRAKKRRRKSG